MCAQHDIVMLRMGRSPNPLTLHLKGTLVKENEDHDDVIVMLGFPPPRHDAVSSISYATLVHDSVCMTACACLYACLRAYAGTNWVSRKHRSNHKQKQNHHSGVGGSNGGGDRVGVHDESHTYCPPPPPQNYPPPDCEDEIGENDPPHDSDCKPPQDCKVVICILHMHTTPNRLLQRALANKAK